MHWNNLDFVSSTHQNISNNSKFQCNNSTYQLTAPPDEQSTSYNCNVSCKDDMEVLGSLPIPGLGFALLEISLDQLLRLECILCNVRRELICGILCYGRCKESTFISSEGDGLHFNSYRKSSDVLITSSLRLTCDEG